MSNLQKEIVCKKCGHTRIPRVKNPLKCSVCGHIPGTKIRNKKEATSQCLQAREVADKKSTQIGDLS